MLRICGNYLGVVGVIMCGLGFLSLVFWIGYRMSVLDDEWRAYMRTCVVEQSADRCNDLWYYTQEKH